MIDRVEMVLQRGQMEKTAGVYKGFIVFEATVSTNDTITLGGLGTIGHAAIAKKSDSSEVTFSKATNVLTITTEGLVGVAVIGWALET